MTDEELAIIRQRFEEVCDGMSVADFRRLHAKLLDAVLILEHHFQRRFPVDWQTWYQEFYGDSDEPRLHLPVE